MGNIEVGLVQKVPWEDIQAEYHLEKSKQMYINILTIQVSVYSESTLAMKTHLTLTKEFDKSTNLAGLT